MMQYKYGIEQCSVADKDQLVRFREKRSEWFDWLEMDEQHNIHSQIHSLMWSDAIYRSLNEARRFSSKDNPTAAVNGSFCEFVDIGYVSSQILGICKLIDGRRDVISLRRLFNDINEHRQLLTRECFVSFDGLPYDFNAARNVQLEGLNREERNMPRWIPTTGPEAWGMSEIAHLAFDKLSGVAANDRKRMDPIHPRIFEAISSWFDAPILQTFQIHRHKFIAHAADMPSRQVKPLDRLGLSLDEIMEAQRTIIKIATAIGSHVLHGSALGGIVPAPQFDVFESLDMPVIPAGNMHEMGEWWHQHEADREDWLADPF